MKREFLRKISDPPLTTCPECGKEELQKMVTAAGFQLKGTGWYVTDFKGGPTSTPASTSSAAGESKSGTGEAKTESASEAKSDTATPAKSDAPASSTPAAAPAPASKT
jgi:putative FmdB family regulatory protein